ncbi:MAG TPA: calcium:proton antiporter, partial [Nitrospiraceae bacterium]|jgi:Ca2+:H+ antiporter
MWLSDLSNPLRFTVLFLTLFSVILLSAFSVVRHAESLAILLQEPVGTLVLTLSVTGIEVSIITASMFTGIGNPTLVRDAMFAVMMIVLNGMVGLSLLLGAWRYHEQSYNLQGANSFLAVIIPIAVLGLILPSFTTSSPGPTFSPLQATFLVVMSTGLYGVFLAIQNTRHRPYFVWPSLDTEHRRTPKAGSRGEARSVLFHTGLLLLYFGPLVILAKHLAVPIDHGIRILGAPRQLGGVLVAVLVLAPESLAAVRAALKNELQRSINILLGSVLATISLTIPAVLSIGLTTGKTITLGLEGTDQVMLVLTLLLSTLTFSRSRTNVLVGAVHSLLFLAYLMLIFER